MSNLLNQAQQAVSGVMGGKSQSGQQKEQQAGLSNITIHHDQAGNRFYCQLENNQEAYLSYRITDQVYQEKKLVELTYLFVPESYREKGLGQQLTTVFFTFLKGNNYACKIENKEVREYVCNKVLSDKSNLALKDIRWEADKNICIC